jgi:hypothetical protein
MRTETPRFRQLTFQLGHATYVLTRRTLPVEADAPSYLLSRRPLEKAYSHCRWPNGLYTDASMLPHFQEWRFPSVTNTEVRPPEN